MKGLPALIIALAAAAVSQPVDPALKTAAEEMRSERYDRAADVLEKLTAQPSGVPVEAFLLLIDCRMREGKLKLALETAEKGLGKYPESLPLLKMSGRLLTLDRGDSATTNAPLTKAAKLAPDDPETHYYLAQWACLRNQEELCIAEARKALALPPRNEQASLQLNTLIGIAADKLNRPNDAETAFQESLRSNRRLGLPDSVAAYRYVDFLLKRARDEDAQAVVGEILKGDPSFGPAHLERAKYLGKEGKWEQAIPLAEKALGLSGMEKNQLRTAHMLLARAYFLLGREEEAMKHQAWIEQNPH
jgi:tetratricopeptide (TPR) repeat protein